MSTWTSFVKIWTVSNCEFNANFLTFLGLYYFLFALETIGVSLIIIWWLILFKKRPFQFWGKIWILVVVILLQLYKRGFYVGCTYFCSIFVKAISQNHEIGCISFAMRTFLLANLFICKRQCQVVVNTFQIKFYLPKI